MTAQRSSARIEGLKAATAYVVQVRARTVAGYGRYSNPTHLSTNRQGAQGLTHRLYTHTPSTHTHTCTHALTDKQTLSFSVPVCPSPPCLSLSGPREVSAGTAPSDRGFCDSRSGLHHCRGCHLHRLPQVRTPLFILRGLHPHRCGFRAHPNLC